MRFVFDIGSGGVRSEIAMVDACHHKLLKATEHQHKSVRLAKCMERREDGNTYIIDSCKEGVIESVREMQQKAKINCHEVQCSGIATEWARRARNANEILSALNKEGLKIHIVDQETEGLIGFHAVALSDEAKDVQAENLAVWDIGGASFQFVIKKDKLQVYEGRYGTEVFEQTIRHKMQKPVDTQLPFFNTQEIPAVLEASREILRTDELLNSPVVQEIKQNKLPIFAIGTPFSKLIATELNLPTKLKKEDVLNTIQLFSGKTIADIQGMFPKLNPPYIHNNQIALIMIYVIMEALDVEHVAIVNTTMTKAVAVSAEYWE